jgi:hypothetical protein
MPRTDRAALAPILRGSIASLDWLNTIPHTIDQVIGLHAEATRNAPRKLRHGLTNDEIIASISGGGGGGSSGHADPTAMAALWGEPDAVDDLDLQAIDSALELCWETAVELDHAGATACDLNPWNPIRQRGRAGTVQGTLAHLHHAIPNLAAAEEADPGHVRFLVVTSLDETAAWLKRKAEAIWRASRGETEPAAVQRTLVDCSNCGGWRTGTIAVRKGLCEQCARFQDAYKFPPNEAITRAWDYGRERLTPAMIAEAKADAAGRRKKRAG